MGLKDYKVVWFTEGGWQGKVSLDNPNMRNDVSTKWLLGAEHYPIFQMPQILEHFRGTEQGSQLAKLLCWQHHVEPEAATDVFLDSIEKLLNNFVEQRAEVLLQKARAGQMTVKEKQELQAILNA